ncbi:MAG: aminotransferase class V-fold PLP-dependent enzyme, partial [Pseudomonadota bacterium]
MSAAASRDLIYMDYAATTPLAPEALAVMQACIEELGYLGNPSSVHLAGRRARSSIEQAREQVAALLNAKPSEIVFTSGATEADNLAIQGAARFRRHR